jgi:hypothetical protein
MLDAIGLKGKLDAALLAFSLTAWAAEGSVCLPSLVVGTYNSLVRISIYG